MEIIDDIAPKHDSSLQIQGCTTLSWDWQQDIWLLIAQYVSMDLLLMIKL